VGSILFADGKLKRKSRLRQEPLRWRLQIDPTTKGDLAMKKTLALLVASTALTAAIGLPAWSAIRAPADGDGQPFAAVLKAEQDAVPLIFASDDDDDEPEYRRAHDDDDDDDDDDDECDDDDNHGCGAPNPAPAGTVAPPQNGLFGNGAPPRVQVN
jgi:hypothetical protein